MDQHMTATVFSAGQNNPTERLETWIVESRHVGSPTTMVLKHSEWLWMTDLAQVWVGSRS